MDTNTTGPQPPCGADDGRVRILIVDDEEGILDMLTVVLKSSGYAVDRAVNGTEGIEKIQHGKFNIVISDIRMPRLGGVEALDTIKRIDPSIEVIMTTGFGTADLAAECMRKGAFDILQKPYGLDELFSCIQKALDKQRSSR